MSRETLPKYTDLMLPVLRAVAALGGSAAGGEISNQIVEDGPFREEDIAIQYPNRPVSVLLDRMDWARSYCKLAGLLESPRRGLFLLTPAGRDVLAMPDEEAKKRVIEFDRQVRKDRPPKQARPTTATTQDDDEQIARAVAGTEAGEESEAWRGQLLARLHRLTPTGFEEFTMYLLRLYGLHLTRVGGTGDEGIDGIGTAPLSEVLSATVAVQAKRLDPSSSVGRDTVALFQRDAAAAGAERAVFVTLARFTAPARKAATTVTPRVDLIDGSRLCDLVRDQSVGVTLQPIVNDAWFDRFD